ncbi:formate dehydrogenase accessory sulfurtransferase FdhD [Candidatus Margulisiibacteriota bacterium]
MFEETSIVRIKLKEGAEKKKDRVAREVPFSIKINGAEKITILASPGRLKELAAGYLYAEAWIGHRSEIEELRVNEKAFYATVHLKNKIDPKKIEKERVITSGCGRNISFYNFEDFENCLPLQSDLTVTAGAILKLMQEFQQKSEVFKETGGVHSAALCQKDKIVQFAEDIGRHNAVDKIVGGLVLEGGGAQDKYLLLSGRISSEMLLKASRVGFPIIVSRAAPTDMAVRLAKRLKITLVGFARGSRMNIYSEERRILCQK